MGERPFDVVVLSGVEWDASWQRHHAFAALWARAGHRVFFVENTGTRVPGWRDAGRVAARLRRALSPAARPARELPPGIEVLSPLVLPPTSASLRAANARALVPRAAAALKARGLGPAPVVFAYLPTATTLALLDRLAPSLVVYDCVDNLRGLRTPPPDLERQEAALMARSGLVLTTSRTLYDERKDRHPNVLELHHGAAPEFFLPPRAPAPHRRFAYFGTLWRALDYAAVSAVAAAGFEVSLIGPAKEPPPPLPSNVSRAGPVAREALPGLLAGFDALLLPYVDDEYNRGVIPAKTYECLATGRPVLASPLPSLKALRELDVLRYARTPDEWSSAARALDAEETPSAREARVAVARAHSEENAFSVLAAAVEAARRKP